MTAYYNEIDPFAVQWLRNLIDAGRIAQGIVDSRSIEDVTKKDIDGFTQCHFFAGIGGWSLALRLAGWPDDRPVWTGSCPCQSFSAAGEGGGFADERHLWPAWHHLIRECRPATIFGEQVDAAIKYGWLCLVQADLERDGYAVGSCVLPAAGVGAPHIRHRLWFVADSNSTRRRPWRTSEKGFWEDAPRIESSGFCITGDLGNAESEGLQGPGCQCGKEACGSCRGLAGLPSTPWANCEWVDCVDGKKRPIEPGSFPLAHGVPNRVGRLRGYGNAIVPQAAAEIIKAYMDNTE